MSVRAPHFQDELTHITKIHHAYANQEAELTAIATALASDTTLHDATIETPPAALRIGPAQSHFSNDVLHIVNIAKAGNLPATTMIAVIDEVAGLPVKPGLIDVPYASANAHPVVIGTVCSCTTGNWIGSPTSYTYQWRRDGTNISGGTSANYPAVAADIGGHALTCVVKATNAQGTTTASPSNAIAT